MKIQLGTIYMNKTKKYLLPCLREYGEEFTDRITNLFKLAVGIGDFALIDMGIQLDKHVFILIDTNLSRKYFNSTMNWLRIQDFYGFDYPYDDIHTGHLHMIAIKLPEKYYDTFGKFNESHFSEMYKEEDLDNLFQNKEELKVLKKDKDYMVQFVNEVNQIYLTDIDPTEWTGELDFPILLDEEMFNKEK